MTRSIAIFNLLQGLSKVLNDPKSASFPNDVIDYKGSFKFLNQAKKMDLEKYYLEMVWFIGFRCLDHEIFKLKDQ